MLFRSGGGGSGIVILAYTSSQRSIDFIESGLTYTLDTTTRSGYKVYKFTAGTGRISWYSGTAPSPTVTPSKTPSITPTQTPCPQTCTTSVMLGDAYGDYNVEFNTCLNNTFTTISGNCGSNSCNTNNYFCPRNSSVNVISGNGSTGGWCCQS